MFSVQSPTLPGEGRCTNARFMKDGKGTKWDLNRDTNGKTPPGKHFPKEPNDVARKSNMAKHPAAGNILSLSLHRLQPPNLQARPVSHAMSTGKAH